MYVHSSWRMRVVILGSFVVTVLAGCSKAVVDHNPGKSDTTTVRISLSSGTYLVSNQLQTLHRSKREMIRWFNSTDQAVEFSFKNGLNPFLESEVGSIAVPAHAHSGWFVIEDGQKGHKEYPYNGTPTLSGPPGDPVVSADD